MPILEEAVQVFTDLISCNALEFIHLSMVVTHDSQSRRSWLYFNVVLFLKPFNSLNLSFEYLPMEAIAHSLREVYYLEKYKMLD